MIAVAAIFVVPLWWLFGPRDLICFGERIRTPEQAMALAKGLIVTRTDVLEEAGYASGDAYVAAIERDPHCCSASYGPRLFEGAGSGWSVFMSATHLPNEYRHEVEFDRCGTVSYNGGLGLKGALWSRTPGRAPPQPQ